MNSAVLGRAGRAVAASSMVTGTMATAARVIVAAAAIGAAWGGAALAQAPTSVADPGFLEQFAATNRFRQGNPTAITLTPEGDAVLFLRSGPRTFVNDLYEFDCATGKERVLLTAEGILKGAEEKLTAEELARRERARSSARGIAGYSLSDDGAKILTTLSGRLFVIDRKTAAVRELKSEHSPKFPIDARFSPDGSKVSVVRDGDLYVIDIGALGEGAPPEGRERRLTTKTSDTITNGLAEFVAQEEMDRRRGYWWSPDSAMIAFQQTDTKGMEMFSIADPMDPGKPTQTWPYPRAGGKNAEVRLGILNLKSGATEGGMPGTPDPVWVRWDEVSGSHTKGEPPCEYLANVRWDEDTGLVVTAQSRRQGRVQVTHVVDASTGKLSPFFPTDSWDKTWVNLDPALPRGAPRPGGFLVTTEKGLDQDERGWVLWYHGTMNGVSGGLMAVVAGPAINYRGGLFGLDKDSMHAYVAGGEDPTQTHVYRVSFDVDRLADKSMPAPVAVTSTPGQHSAAFSKDGEVCVHSCNAPDGSRSWTVRRAADWSPIGQLSSVCEIPSFPLNIEITEVTAPDPADGLEHLGFKKGEPISFKAMVIRPRNFDKAKKYPVIDAVYGGPHAQTVTQSGSGQWLNQWIADHGFIVVSIDGRGTPSRGRAWERAIKGDLIKVPMLDQIAGLQALGEKFPEMDMSRVGVYGWSFGGYFSAMATMREPGVFKCGVAGAPVCDWRDYDTHYTERYMGLPEENKAGYDAANVLTYCKDLTVPLLIIHGTADDNVYFMHALKMSNALFRAGKPHEFLPLAGFTHMVPDPVVVKSLYGRVVGFFEENLKERAR